MNLATRILGVAIFVSVLAGATYGAFQVFGEEPQVTSVELQQPSRVPTLLAGQPTPIALGVQNTGGTDVNFTLSTTTEGFDLQLNPEVQSVPAGNSTRVRGLLGADQQVEGEFNVTVVARDNETGDPLDSVGFNATVIPPSPPDLSLEAVMPAVLPGENATLQASLTNTVGATQRVNLSVVSGPGNVEPAQVPLRPNGTGTATVTVSVPQDAPRRFEVSLRASNQAGQSTSARDTLSVVPEGEIVVEPLRANHTVEPGDNYTLPVVVVSNADVSGNITVSGTAVVNHTLGQIEARDNAGGFVTLNVPSGAPQNLQQSFTVDVAGQQVSVTSTVSTTPEGDQPSQGQQAEVEYVGRLLDGTVFGTSMPGVAEGPFPKNDTFRGGRQIQPMTVRIGAPRQQAPPGVVAAVQNMTVGQSSTVQLSPEEAFGPERRTQELSATTEIPRRQNVPKTIPDVPKNQLPAQFDIENRTEGDVIEFDTQAGDVPITLRFRLVEKGERTVTLERVAEVGETITFYAPWPNATEVVDVNETTVVYETFPPETATEDPFTWNANPRSHEAKWENATVVDSQASNETTIVLRHQPEEGLEYTTAGGPRSPPRSFRVENVTSENVVVSTPNQNPLGGQPVIFDLTVLDVSQAQQRRLPAGLGGG